MAAFTSSSSPVRASWEVIDPQPSSGLASVFATTGDGRLINTTALGRQSFSVVATDNASHTTDKTVEYLVTYRVRALEPVPQASFDGGQTPKITAPLGQKILFSFKVQDYFETAISNANGVLTALDARTRAIVPVETGVIGSFHFDEASGAYNYLLDSSKLPAGNYVMIVQFNDFVTIYRLELTLQAN